MVLSSYKLIPYTLLFLIPLPFGPTEHDKVGLTIITTRIRDAPGLIDDDLLTRFIRGFETVKHKLQLAVHQIPGSYVK